MFGSLCPFFGHCCPQIGNHVLMGYVLGLYLGLCDCVRSMCDCLFVPNVGRTRYPENVFCFGALFALSRNWDL